MTNEQAQLDDLMKAINELNNTITDKISKNEYDNISEPVLKRFKLINQLVGLSSENIDKKRLHDYLADLQKHDETIIDSIKKEHTHVRNVLSNLHNLQTYSQP